MKIQLKELFFCADEVTSREKEIAFYKETKRTFAYLRQKMQR